VLDDPITFAGRGFQTFAIEELDLAALVTDEVSLLQFAGDGSELVRGTPTICARNSCVR
jgi:hypothetical protein